MINIDPYGRPSEKEPCKRCGIMLSTMEQWQLGQVRPFCEKCYKEGRNYNGEGLVDILIRRVAKILGFIAILVLLSAVALSLGLRSNCFLVP